MPDRETVITHLQIIHTWATFARERDLQFFTPKHLEDIAQWSDDALALLKERKHGKWTTHRTQQHDGEWYCDQCDYEPTVFEATSYCPNCGAMMELDK